MPRVLTSGVQTQIAAEAAEFIFLMEFDFSTSTVRFSTGPQDTTWNGFTWLGIGGTLGFNAVIETTDDKAQGAEMKLSGVDTSIIAIISAEHYIGRKVKVWKAYLANGAIVADPISAPDSPLFVGVMNAGFEIEEDVGATPPTVTVTGRVVSRLALLDQERGFRTNVQSHQRIYPGDTFFQNVAALPLTPIYWGMDYPPGAPIRT